MKKSYELKYGRGSRTVCIAEDAEVQVFSPAFAPTIADVEKEIGRALDSPLDAPRLSDLPEPGRAAIAIPDKSRALPAKAFLKVLLARMFSIWPGLSRERVTVIVGGGLHARMDESFLSKLAASCNLGGCRVMAHDAGSSEMETLGRTRRGTPVMINSAFARADLKIVIGQIDPHQFVGFTGGAKGVAVGLGSAESIERNHSLMSLPGAQAGTLDGNPVREDLSEAGSIVGIDLAVNAVLDADNRIAGIFAGAPGPVLRQGSFLCSRIYGNLLTEKFDVAVASCGGFPKDLNLYQAQKALGMASRAVKPGGKIALIAECEEGVGDRAYLEYVKRFGSAKEVLADFESRGFRMGAHKAYLFARALTRFEIVIESEIDRKTLAQCHLMAGRAQDAIDKWVKHGGKKLRVAVIPSANASYFCDDQP
jgi:nickel-dependent lactate racemase